MSRIVFLGTPAIGVPALRLLATEHDVAAVVTRPDRGTGRSRRPSPVRLEAERFGLPVLQPETRSTLRTALSSLEGVEAGVVVAFGMILDGETLSLPLRGFLNAHFSLLPRWRGAAPVARALMAGDPMTGVTVIRLDEGVDTGPVLHAQAVDIGPDETAGELGARLSGLAAHLLAMVLPAYVEGGLEPVPQSNVGASTAPRLTASERVLSVSMSAVDFVNRVRALSPEPGATLGLDGETVQVMKARSHTTSPQPGVWILRGGTIIAGLEEGGVELVQIKPPGRRVMSGAAWARGRRRESGRLG